MMMMIRACQMSDESAFDDIKTRNDWITLDNLARFRGLTAVRRMRILDDERLSDNDCGELGRLLQQQGSDTIPILSPCQMRAQA